MSFMLSVILLSSLSAPPSPSTASEPQAALNLTPLGVIAQEACTDEDGDGECDIILID